MSMSLLLAMAAAAAPIIPSTPDLGIAEGRCRPNESGSAYMINVTGLKDRRGTLRVELYPNDDKYFLGDDNVTIMAGKPFARVAMSPIPKSGPVTVCIRAPGPGSYTLSLLHDRNSNRKFDKGSDGAGFPRIGNLGRSQPKAADVAVTVGGGPQSVNVPMQYLNIFRLGFAKND